MDAISQSFTINNTQRAKTNSPLLAFATALPPDESTPAVTLTITPGANNVSEGDRSQNTAKISLTTPNREITAEVTRENALSAAVRKAQLDAINPGNDPDIIRTSLLLKNAGVEVDDLRELAGALYSRKQINQYIGAIPGLSPISTNSNDSSSTTAAELYGQAQSSYIKQTLFFSKIDQRGSLVNTEV